MIDYGEGPESEAEMVSQLTATNGSVFSQKLLEKAIANVANMQVLPPRFNKRWLGYMLRGEAS